jgi:hypothetical protein
MSIAEQAAAGRIVVRPSAGMLVKNFFDSSDGKLVFYGLVFALGVVVALTKASVPAGVALGVVVLAVVVTVAARLRFEVVPGEVRVGNFTGTKRVPVDKIVGISPQQVNFQGRSGQANGTRYRVIVTTTDVDKRGAPVTIPAIASERKSLEWVQELVQASANVATSGRQPSA